VSGPIAKACPQISGAKLSGPEKAFVKLLQQRQTLGEVIWWSEHPVSLRLGERIHYVPDFMAVLADGTICIYEVKGPAGFKGTRLNGGGTGSGNESRAKFLQAVEAYPLFRFVLATKQRKRDGGGFVETIHEPRMGYARGTPVLADAWNWQD
jgi:hypothetical protein